MRQRNGAGVYVRATVIRCTMEWKAKVTVERVKSNPCAPEQPARSGDNACRGELACSCTLAPKAAGAKIWSSNLVVVVVRPRVA